MVNPSVCMNALFLFSHLNLRNLCWVSRYWCTCKSGYTFKLSNRSKLLSISGILAGLLPPQPPLFSLFYHFTQRSLQYQELHPYTNKKILKSQLRRGTWHVLVQWSGLPPSEATWEPVPDFKTSYPEFQLEDKLFPEEGRDVMVSRVYERRKRG